ncbi:MAG: hypothetical protein JST75_19490 [Bacteroidetes bacterium]|nr:hypothetical protein [Bacteroidota bacterium]
MKRIIILFGFSILMITESFAQTSSEKGNNKTISKDQILGTWAAEGQQNATFVIQKNKIFYPDQNASYKYDLSNDHIKIKYDGFDGEYIVIKQSADTLVFLGNEKQVYYRFKK